MRPEEVSSLGGVDGGGGGTTGIGVRVGVGCVCSVRVAGLAAAGGTTLGCCPVGLPAEDGARGAAGAGLLGGGATAAGAGGGGGSGLGWTVPGGAASTTGAPHCSQKSPERSKGPLQKRQTTAPGWVVCLSKDFFSDSSSISTIGLPRLGRTIAGAASARGAMTGVGAILRGTVDASFCGDRVTGSGGGGAA